MVEDGLRGVRLRARPAGHGDLHQVPQDPQRRRLRRLHRRRSWPPARPASSPACPTPTAAAASSATTAGSPLYGVDRLIAAKQRRARPAWTTSRRTEDVIRDREELAEQIRALGRAAVRWPPSYGFDVSGPAATAQRGGPVALLRLPRRDQGAERRRDVARAAPRPSSTSTSQRDLAEGRLDEQQAQELIDDFVIKLRIVRFLRTPEYDAAVLRRPDLGHRVDRRHRRRRPPAGHPHVVPLPADALQPRPGAGAEPHRALVAGAARAGSSGSARRCRSTPARSSTRATTCCGPASATTPRSPAACRRCGSASRCSSSAPG